MSDSDAARFEARLVPFRSIVVDRKRNARKKYVEIDKLAEQIRIDGLLHPLTVEENSDGRWYLRAGFRRYYACELLKLDAVAVREWTPNPQIDQSEDEQRLYINIGENIHRKNLTSFELATACVDARRRFNRSTLFIAERFGYSVSYVLTLIRRRERLHPVILKAWEDEHPAAALERLTDLTMLPQISQLEQWQELVESCQPFDKSKKPLAPLRRWNRPRLRTIEKVISAIEKSTYGLEAQELSIHCLRFGLGEQRYIPGVYKLPG